MSWDSGYNVVDINNAHTASGEVFVECVVYCSRVVGVGGGIRDAGGELDGRHMGADPRNHTVVVIYILGNVWWQCIWAIDIAVFASTL